MNNMLYVAKDILPKPGQNVLAFYKDKDGRSRVVRAEFVADMQRRLRVDDDFDDAIYDEKEDEYYWPSGWYELIDNLDDYRSIRITNGEVTHWLDISGLLKVYRQLKE